MTTDERLMEDIVNEADYDWIDLGHAVAIVAMEENDLDDVALTRRAGTLVAALVRQRRLVPGHIGVEVRGFVPLPGSPEHLACLFDKEVDDIATGRKSFVPTLPFMFAAAGSSSIVWDGIDRE